MAAPSGRFICRTFSTLFQYSSQQCTGTVNMSRPPVRFKTKGFGGFTNDKYMRKHYNKAKEFAKRGRKVPLKTETQSFRELKWPMTVASLNRLLFEHAPLEKKHRAPLHSKLGLSQRWADMKESLSTLYSVATIRRKLRKVDPYLPIEFARQVQDIFIATNYALQTRNKEELRRLTTENALLSLKAEFDNKSFVWQMVEQKERPRVLVARVAPMTTKDNLFAQVVVRIHTKQLLAVYDKAGRLYRGHPSEPRDVLDYVVMERHIAHPSSSWRIAGKLMPAPRRPS